MMDALEISFIFDTEAFTTPMLNPNDTGNIARKVTYAYANVLSPLICFRWARIVKGILYARFFAHAK